MEEDPTQYVGKVKCILQEKGFGFITCEEVKAYYGTDAFLASFQLAGLHADMPITFRVRMNARGQPQALAVKKLDPDAFVEPPAQASWATFLNDAPAQAAPAPKRLAAEHTQWPQAHASQDYSHTFLGKGLNSEDSSPTMGAGLNTSSGSVEDDPMWYVGTVKCIYHDKGFGFITCEECKAVYGTDAFLHSSQLAGLEPGMQITFKVRMNERGQPQAHEPTTLESGAPAQAESAPKRPQAQASQYTVRTAWDEAMEHGIADVGVPVVLNGMVEATGDHSGVVKAVREWLSWNEGGAEPAAVSKASPARPQTASARYSPYDATGGVAAAKTHYDATAGVAAAKTHYDASGGLAAETHWEPSQDWKAIAAAAAKAVWDWEGEARYEGEVKAIVKPKDGKPGFGFVACPVTKAIYGEDVFLHSSQAEHLTEGQKVTFEVQMNFKGRPQATGLLFADGSSWTDNGALSQV